MKLWTIHQGSFKPLRTSLGEAFKGLNEALKGLTGALKGLNEALNKPIMGLMKAPLAKAY